MLTRLINHNDQIPFTSTSLTRFHSRSPPSISISDYLRRIYKYTNPEPICLILILNYIDRICKNLVNFTICSLTVHRFCITSVTIGSKFTCDSFYSNSRYAKVGGISLTEINLLEREFLLAIDYRLSTTNEELDKYYLSLVESHPSYKIDPATTSNQQPMMMITSNKKIDQEMAEEGGRRMEAEIKQIGVDDQGQQEEHLQVVERESKRIKGKDPFEEHQMAFDPNENYPPQTHRELLAQNHSPYSTSHHQQHLSAVATNILPDSIVED
ncbi:hypothetical protein Pst134EA_015769 [Puccinia striiformis f. sp. tritici]|uniref:hypothetical protein n=1 Tax=Puccinia striiformis f. sp. tritici TaxID=168172 RepID=UPI002007C9B5|nr:hypothetical protein Pst134EA_015769 [Puccinia striiformis f. sp. tritici]KAH9463684.1 hypothetical protein Pst134EA_015769 [Puccinia striiformis f. sp. tritici]